MDLNLLYACTPSMNNYNAVILYIKRLFQWLLFRVDGALKNGDVLDLGRCGILCNKPASESQND